ncbi:MAG: DUF6456 domain-containing protein [Pseudomonadota bacterium]
MAHTGRGQSLRAIAAVTGTHPSTIMRTVRRVEERRDDPLLDRMLDQLEADCRSGGSPVAQPATPFPAPIPRRESEAPEPDADTIREGRRYLRRLCEPGSFLLVATGASKAGVFCAANQHRKPIAMLSVALAAQFLRHDWIRIVRQTDVAVRYRITDVGRAFLRRAIAAEEIRVPEHAAAGMAETRTPFIGQHQEVGTRTVVDPVDGAPVLRRINRAESVLGWLAKRPGPDGRPYLTPAEVEAGERLRSDFERAQMAPSITQDWRAFLTPGDRLSGSSPARGPAEGPTEARARVGKALETLGPGLADIVIRVCCFLEGLEACEKRFGWSARSGKVVLKLALQRLSEHYGIGAAH